MIDARENVFPADGQTAGENGLFRNRKSSRPGSIFRLQNREEVTEKKAHLLIVSGRGRLLERDISSMRRPLVPRKKSVWSLAFSMSVKRGLSRR